MTFSTGCQVFISGGFWNIFSYLRHYWRIAVSLQSSQYRRAGFHYNRRRRLLADDCLGAGSRPAVQSEPCKEPAERKSAHYGDAEFLAEQPGLIDLVIIRHLWAIGLWALLGIGLVAGLAILDRWSDDTFASDRPTAFMFGSAGSMSAWLSSVLLLCAAAMAVAIHGVRRHRIDDYDGHYRIWLWAAMGWGLLSADAIVRLHDAFQQVMIRLTGATLLGDGWIWSWFPGLLLLGVVGSRLAIDMWECRLSTAALCLSAVCYGLAAATGAGWLIIEDLAQPALVAPAAKLLGDTLLLLAMALHGRFVLLDAEGLLTRRESKTAKEAPDAASDQKEQVNHRPAAVAKGGSMRVDPPQSVPQPALARTIPIATAAAGPAKSASVVSSSASSTLNLSAASKPASIASTQSNVASVNRKLTKAEKKALRQRLLEEKLNREKNQQGKWTK